MDEFRGHVSQRHDTHHEWLESSQKILDQTVNQETFHSRITPLESTIEIDLRPKLLEVRTKFLDEFLPETYPTDVEHIHEVIHEKTEPLKTTISECVKQIKTRLPVLEKRVIDESSHFSALSVRFTELFAQVEKHLEGVDSDLNNVSAERLVKLCREVFNYFKVNNDINYIKRGRFRSKQCFRRKISEIMQGGILNYFKVNNDIIINYINTIIN